MTDNLSCQILNTFITSTTVDKAVAFLRSRIVAGLSAGAGKYVLNVSLNDVMNAVDDDEYRDIINDALLALPNSRQLSMQMHSEGYPLAQKINIRKFIDKMFSECSGDGFSHYFILKNDSEKEAFEKVIKERYPDLNISGICTVDTVDIDDIKNSKTSVCWASIDGRQQALFVSDLSSKTGVFVIGVGYGMKDWIKGSSVEFTGRLTPHYISTNIKYALKTGKKQFICAISWIPTFIAVFVIFAMSSQKGAVSVENSKTVAEEVIKLSLFGLSFDVSDQYNAIESMNTMVRTVAHILEYLMLSVFLGITITVNGIRDKIRFFITCFLGLCIAVLDEFYQIFVPGRYGDIKDVISDMLGIVAMAGLLYVLGRKRHKKTLVYHNGTYRRRKFLNICIDDVSFKEAVDCIMQMASSSGRYYVITPNSDFVIKMEKDEYFRRILEDADLILTDGTPLMWIADSMGYPIREKIPGADMLPKVCERAALEGKTMFFLGAGEGVAETAALKLEKRYPGLKVVGICSPPVGFENDPEELDKVISAVNDKSADILVVALGAPKQEKFIYENRDRMNFNVALPFGAALDFEAENIRRAPKWMRDAGLEWFFRFLQEPGRMFKRYFVDDMKIFYIAWKYRNEIIRLGEKENDQ